MSARDTQLPASQRGSKETQGGQQTGLSRQTVPSVPSLLLDPLGFFSDPFSVMRRMQQDINRIFSSAGTTTSTREGEGGTLTAWVPPIEIDFRDNNLVISAELPGLNENDVEVDITDDMLIIQGERQVERREDERGFRRTERQYGRFYRAIALPDGADTNNARAEFSNGVLRVTIPVAQEQSQKMRQLPIQAAGSSQPSSKGQSAGQQSGSTSASEKEKAA